MDGQHIDAYGFIRPGEINTSPQKQRLENVRLEKWHAMLQDWDNLLHTSLLKKRIRKGIPNSIRGEVWMRLSGVEQFKSQYPEYEVFANTEAECPSMSVLKADVQRTYTRNVMFKHDLGIEALHRMLVAYAAFDPEVGYTQGMSYVAGMCLLYLSEEDAFWLFATIMNFYGMRKCFVQGMPRVKCCFYISNALLRHTLPKVFDRLNKLQISPLMYATQWFMTGFTIGIPIEYTLRIWDCYFYEEQKIFFRMHLGVMKVLSPQLKTAEFDQAIELLMNIERINMKLVIEAAFKVRVARKTIDRLLNDYMTQPKPKYVNWSMN